MPIAVVIAPSTPKKIIHCPFCVNESNTPNMTSSAARGIICNTPSALALLSEVVTSVIHALNAASLAVEPIAVIRQSITIIITVVRATAFADGKNFSEFSFVIRANANTLSPQRT